ncbi:hypothetical protein Bbelb_351610 [Branchiostoma belcheri]|nr:hypothetical protein Bbelb_351610 [Branchiostoma belcheri]
MSRLVNFSVRLFSLDHHDRRAFYTSPVLKNQTVFVLYRVLVAAFWGSFNVWAVLHAVSKQDWLWFARLTHWTMTLLTAHLVYSAALALKHRYCSSADDDTQSFSTDNGSKLTWYYKTAWLLANLAYSSSFCVTALYLTLIATPRYFIGIMEHIVNTVIVALDILLNGIPL